MPRASGLDALEHIRNLSPQTPVILFTAHDENCLRDCRAVLATAWVAKAEDLADLKRVVAQNLRRRVSEVRTSLRLGLPPFPARMELA